MSPYFTSSNLSDMHRVSVEFKRQFSVGPAVSTQTSYLQNLLFCEPRMRVVDAFLRSSSSFGYAISPVVALCPEPQMTRSKTSRIISRRAIVKHMETLRDGSMCKSESQNVTGPEISASPNPTVTATCPARPNQAAVALWHRLKKHLLEQFVATNAIVGSWHLRALPWLRCVALATFTCCGAFFIVSSGESIS